MGLGCSEQIVSKIGGDITVKSSKRGLTVFAFKLPVTVQFSL
jgi:signal transduction histidine kinase